MMVADPTKDDTDTVDRLLQEVYRTLQDNQRFLATLKQDRLDEDDLAAEVETAADEEFEEL